MSVINMTGTGAGGIDPDELTALQKDVVKGKIAGVSGFDEPVEGTLELTGNTAESDVVSGKTFYSDNPYLRKTGSLSLTGNAQIGHVLAGETFYTNNCKTKLTGTMTVNSLLSFSVAAYSGRRVLAKWQNPNQAAGKPFSGVIIRYSTSGYPGVTGGTQVYKGAGNNTAVGGWSQTYIDMPALNTTYYFSCYPYMTCSAGEKTGTALNAVAITSAVINITFTSSGSYTIPAGYTKADLFVVGGGGKAWSGNTGAYGVGGAGSGRTATKIGLAISVGQKATITIGAGGTTASNKVASGGTTSVVFPNLTLSALGGDSQNFSESYTSGGGGGSGGGGASYYRYGHQYDPGGVGGTNGGNGANVTGNYATTLGGKGQGTTTRAFGSSSGTLYAGGGGGSGGCSGAYSYTFSNGGAGGAGGGGRGGNGAGYNHRGENGVAGAANTGGGGGGGGSGDGGRGDGGNGGSGIALIKLY